MQRTLWYNPRLDNSVPKQKSTVQWGENQGEVELTYENEEPGLTLLGGPPAMGARANCISSWSMGFHSSKGMPSLTTAMRMARLGKHQPAIDLDFCKASAVDHSALRFEMGLSEPDANDLCLAFIEAEIIEADEAWYADDNRSLTLGPIHWPFRVVDSSTAGHSHLYIDREMSWPQYENLLEVMATVGLVENGYLEASKARGQSFLRTNHDKPVMLNEPWSAPWHPEPLTSSYVGENEPKLLSVGMTWYNPRHCTTRMWNGVGWLPIHPGDDPPF